MKDRIPALGQEGRVRIIPEDGSTPFYARMEMADNPLEDGTPLTKGTLLTDETADELWNGAEAPSDPTVNNALGRLNDKVNTKQNQIGSQTANLFFAAPNGANGNPSFRAIVSADLPVVPVSKGGTGLTASPSLLVNLASTAAANVLAASPRPGVTGTLPVGNLPTVTVAKGGTGKASWTANRLIYPSAATTLAQLAFPATEGSVLRQGTSGAPYWTSIADLFTALGAVKMESGSATGNFTVSFIPKVLIIAYKNVGNTGAGRVGVATGSGSTSSTNYTMSFAFIEANSNEAIFDTESISGTVSGDSVTLKPDGLSFGKVARFVALR